MTYSCPASRKRRRHRTQAQRVPSQRVPLSPQMLARLLKSSHPEDLRAANKLIKEMVQEVIAESRAQGGGGRGC